VIGMASGGRGKSDLTGLAAARIEEAMARVAVLKRHLEDGVPLSRAAADADISIRTAERWLSRYLNGGLVGLARSARSDIGLRKLSAEIVELIEGMALQKPRLSTATLHRRIVTVARQQGWSPPSYSSIHSIVAALVHCVIDLAPGESDGKDRRISI
jgi:putative transposase